MRHDDEAPEIAAVEWVADHLEAHGHFLVHGSTIAEVISRVRAALDVRPVAGSQELRLRILHAGWWQTEACDCRRSLACSNHPRWHYRPAAATDRDAWRGAEVRLVLAMNQPGAMKA
ncbi:hypothetical protein DMA12_46765 [Amycolatopsis balhimycina DSM 5908]|uniref:Uncharacterized protein n=1 Tax=Amycolatopsis balhimycina DSM 5908 TaxID=1081091 RepID=A0A428VVH9_AMYBA|nr:hypothetical protein [Amycolatopsis balhimycina]RSM34817.1 hypothetical protein DMA12_46765 [Amycolatopsis balhimycina DSM 5908]